MSAQEKFVNSLKTISGANDFHSLEIKDSETQEKIDCGYLHEIYCGEVKSDV